MREAALASIPADAAMLHRLARTAHITLRYLLGALLIAMTLANGLNAGARYLFGTQMRGADELLAFSQVALVMMGLILVTAERRHLSVDLWPEGGVVNALRRLALSAVMLAVCLYAAIQSFAFVSRMMSFGATSMGLGAPMWIPHGFVLVGFGATAAVALLLLVSDTAALARAMRAS
ncbi:MAG: TRAP transporter small permease subunit [Devosia sp.]